MNHFETRSGDLYCEDVSLAAIAAAVGTPVYVYSQATLERHFHVFREALRSHANLGEPLIAYAVKANGNVSVLRVLGALGAGADTVSEGEVRRALAAGIPASRIVFSGVGKRPQEIEFALRAGVAEINVESEPELDLIAAIAERLTLQAPVVFRVNPDVEAGGHAKIATGKAENKFGVSFTEARRLYAKAADHPHLNPLGVACHIGSQIIDLTPFEQAFSKMRGLVETLRAEGHSVERLDLGGGLGVPYFNMPEPPSPADYAAMIARVIGDLDVQLAFEPGRMIAANAGVLVAQVLHRHERPEGRKFLVLDAAMNDLLRPAMYDAFHDIRPIAATNAEPEPFDVVGPVCETGDTFTRDRVMPSLDSGDLVAFMSAGAYGAAMASEYNSRPLVPEVLVHGDRFAVIRRRPTYEEMLADEAPADWL
ncbi:diaminopimelate decarboxylase [Caulobacter sp. NIBR1757]|uniref:diaminopimelate decarboxylase n=1 Tax=Caulobacter sp. NIBR1757 TaxID=3016000 RepID=UPI0022F01797|nr:diaminopimelate decarboxylase [Caulobacter sp. NIBR1757]WGM38995.1 Diaminopimelate decarboxylase [Caulobacter sp. NIBR1757]